MLGKEAFSIGKSNNVSPERISIKTDLPNKLKLRKALNHKNNIIYRRLY